jgi:hypothetical protein
MGRGASPTYLLNNQKMKNTELKNFCDQHAISSDAEKRSVVLSGMTILSIMKEHEMPIDNNSLAIIKRLYGNNETSVCIAEEYRISDESINSIKSLSYLPTLPVVSEIKALIDKATETWLSTI